MRKPDISDELLKSMTEAVAILRGECPPARRHLVPLDADPRVIRNALGLSQVAFAARFGLGLAALRDWEQGRRQPSGSASMLLRIAQQHPEVFLELK